MSIDYDVAVAGGGAAGLMAGIFAARSGGRVVILDGAKKIGAKILISGGGRCNITHDAVYPDDFIGNVNAIRKVLRSFPVDATVRFFADLGVALKREETGKLFPVSDSASSVVDALLAAVAASGAEIRTSHRVTRIERRFGDEPFMITASDTEIRAARVVLATGGRSVPKTGSDGFGYELARSLGHTVTTTFPALVPLVLPDEHWTTTLSGTSIEGELAVLSTSGGIIRRERGSLLFTHFGLSGPAVLDISRHWIAAQPAALTLNFLPGTTFEMFESMMLREATRNPRATISSVLRASLPERVIDTVCSEGAGLESTSIISQITREGRRRLAHAFTRMGLPVTRDRGFDYAEVTAGGVPLNEIEIRSMQSRICPGLHLCGEILDVDGRIGGYNFQWAWATGRLAGIGAAAQLERNDREAEQHA